MNKMIKGAAVAGLGVALLLGGAGTLAVWNAAAETDAGAIVAGNLDLVAGDGVWVSELSGAVVDIATYHVIPGESLTYSQPLTVTLVGEQLKAALAVTGADAIVNDGFADNFEVSQVQLTNTDGEIRPTDTLTEETDGDVLATVTFEFKSSTDGRESVDATYDFSKVGFVLEQQAPGQN